MPPIAMIVWNEFRNDARVLKQARTLQAAGYQVTVFALHTPGVTQRREVLADGIRVIRVARSLRWRPASAGSCASTGSPPTEQSMPLRRILSRLWVHAGLLVRIALHRAAVVHAHDVNTLPTAWLAARLSGARLVYDAHEVSTSREGYARFRKWVACIEKALMPRAEGTITTTQSRAKFFARAYGITRPLVLQNRPRLIASPPSQRIRHELGLKRPWPIVLYQGGLQQGRGLERLLRVAVTLQRAYFVLIGGGRLTTPLKTLSEELGLTERVHFIPTVSLADLPGYTASADIGVQPIENTCLNHLTTDSNKLFEYIIAGLPVVATAFPEIRKIVRSHAVGLLVTAGSDQSLHRELQRLIDEPLLRQTLAQNAKNAASSLSWEQQESNLVTLYERVLTGKTERCI
ncbi:glycosyltransferase family 4 protein [Pseudomonas sp. EA_65y_Pfl1_P113]|uniref:glycosyltransferase family 4 protein n=1 Tax=Pseudomonas sp. EA_65y_Pfl1_P113 TaxID=3088692 RepID=UPI0030DD9619